MTTTSEIRIAAATPADVPTILRLVRGLAEYERLASAVTATEAELHERLFGAGRAAEALLAYSGGEAVGVAVYFQTFSTFLAKPGIYLEDIYVEERCRGQGIGRAIMQHIARLAVERGCARFEWAVLNWNQPAIGFYERLGARPQNEWTVHRLSGEALLKLAGG